MPVTGEIAKCIYRRTQAALVDILKLVSKLKSNFVCTSIKVKKLTKKMILYRIVIFTYLFI